MHLRKKNVEDIDGNSNSSSSSSSSSSSAHGCS
ncbi:hypothetical protein Goshw_011808, partial [Gossypium schwendimanii]|nr:hypothetical protein [Gossypium schwendimanii]